MAAKASKCGRLQLCTCATERSITRLRSGAEAGRTLCPQDSGQEELPHIRGQGKKLRVPGCDSTGGAERSYPTSKVSGGRWEELPPPEVGVAAEKSNPSSKEWWLRGHRRAERSYSTFKVRRGGSEEIPLVQGREPWLHFAGAAVKRYPMPKVRETKIRW